MSTTQHPEGASPARSFEEMVVLATWLAEQDERMLFRLIEARKAANMTQRDVAAALGIKQSSVAAFERHDNDPRLSTIRRYALAVDCAVSHQVQPAKTAERGSAWVTAGCPVEFSVSKSGASTQNPTLAPSDSKRTDFAMAA